MAVPNFFIVGAPKCGTTALSEYLRAHPRVFMSTPKEPFYWSDDIAVDEDMGIRFRTLEDYLALFAQARPEHLRIGEASTTSIWSATALSRIMQFAPACRIIAMVRSPLAMVQSLHQEELFCFIEDQVDFETAWSLQEHRAQGRNLPAKCSAPQKLQYRWIASLGTHVQKLYQLVPPLQRLVIVYDDFARDPARVYAKVLEFLDLPEDGRTDFRCVNASRRHFSSRLARLLLRPPPCCRPVVSLLRILATGAGLRGIRSTLVNTLAFPRPRPPLRAEFRERLVETFRDEVLLLGELLERDLSGWLDAPDAGIRRRGECAEAAHDSATDHGWR